MSSIEEYTKYLEKKWGSAAPEGVITPAVWEVVVWLRIVVEAAFWCSTSLLFLWTLWWHSIDISWPKQSAIWLCASAILFLLCRFLPGHLSISIGRALSVGIMWSAVWAAGDF